MTFDFKHGNSILEKPFREAKNQRRRHQHSVPPPRKVPSSSSYICILFFYYVISWIIFLLYPVITEAVVPPSLPSSPSSTSLSSSLTIMNTTLNSSEELKIIGPHNNNQEKQFTLQYHQSPWITVKVVKKFTDSVCWLQQYYGISCLAPTASAPLISSSSSTNPISKWNEPNMSFKSSAATNTNSRSDFAQTTATSISSVVRASTNTKTLTPLTWDNSLAKERGSTESLRDDISRLSHSNYNQCLVLDTESVNYFCDSSSNSRSKRINEHHLKFCHGYSLKNVLSNETRYKVINTSSCRTILNELQILDNLAQRLSCEFETVLSRYNCQSGGYSVKWSCNECWVSGSIIIFLSVKIDTSSRKNNPLTGHSVHSLVR